MTKADQIRAVGMSIAVDDATAKMLEFRETVEGRQLAVISSQLSEIERMGRRNQELENRIVNYQLVLAGVTAVALFLLGKNLGWL